MLEWGRGKGKGKDTKGNNNIFTRRELQSSNLDKANQQRQATEQQQCRVRGIGQQRRHQAVVGVVHEHEEDDQRGDREGEEEEAGEETWGGRNR